DESRHDWFNTNIYDYHLDCSILYRYLVVHDHDDHPDPDSFPTRRSSDLGFTTALRTDWKSHSCPLRIMFLICSLKLGAGGFGGRSEEHTSELQSREKLVCRLLLEKKKKK